MEAGEALYAACVEQALRPDYFKRFSVPDTLEGRFEMVALHVWLVIRRLKGKAHDSGDTGQALFDAMFANLDISLREIGVGDLVVGKKIKKLAENFYGRAGAYEAGLTDDADEATLTEALSRNVYETRDAPGAPLLADYVRRAAAEIEIQPIARLAGGVVRFPDPLS